MRFNTLYPDIIVEIVKIRDFTHNNKDMKIKSIDVNSYCYETESKLISEKEYFDIIRNGTINTHINQKYINICNRRLIKYLHNRFSMNYQNFTTDDNLIISSYRRCMGGSIQINYNVLSKYWNIFNIIFCLKQAPSTAPIEWELHHMMLYGYNYIDDVIQNILFDIKSDTIVDYETKRGITLTEKFQIHKAYNLPENRTNIELYNPEFNVSRKYFI